MNIGVLALQGAFREHRLTLTRCGCESTEIRHREQLAGVDGLIIPGGESTTIGKLMQEFDLMQEIASRGAQGMPIFGTCAGMIMLAKDISGSVQPRLGLMDISVARNGFGRQVDSFEVDLTVPALGTELLRAVFIRAPYVLAVKPHVTVLAEHEGRIVLVRQENFLACAFHPELTPDLRIHMYFLDMVSAAQTIIRAS